MFHFSPRVFVQLSVVGVCFTAAATQVQAQAVLVNTSATSKSSNNNQAWHDSLPEKLISARVNDGILTIDGLIAKIQLNYNIQKAGYLYFFVPGTGTAIVSLSPMSNAVKVKNAFDGKKLAFTAGGHQFELTSKSEIDSKRDAYVIFDSSTVAVARSPRFGFGKTMQSPYAWPLAKPAPLDKEAHLVQPPPMPSNMTPATTLDAQMQNNPASKPDDKNQH
jgi:hypothetical protein